MFKSQTIVIFIFICLSIGISKKMIQVEEGRVINGRRASITKFPFTVDYSGCAGAILSDKWIVSAAHCFDPTLKRKLRVGSDRRSKGNLVQVKKGYRHPKYKAHDYWGIYDILLLELSEALVFNETVKPIQLEDVDWIPDNSSGIVAAFGRTGASASKSKVLLEGELVVVSNDECSKYVKHYNPVMMLCARSLGPHGSNLCRGDSGAVLVVAGKAVGIVSWGDDECPVEGYTTFARLSVAKDWIKSLTGI